MTTSVRFNPAHSAGLSVFTLIGSTISSAALGGTVLAEPAPMALTTMSAARLISARRRARRAIIVSPPRPGNGRSAPVWAPAGTVGDILLLNKVKLPIGPRLVQHHPTAALRDLGEIGNGRDLHQPAPAEQVTVAHADQQRPCAAGGCAPCHRHPACCPKPAKGCRPPAANKSGRPLPQSAAGGTASDAPRSGIVFDHRAGAARSNLLSSAQWVAGIARPLLLHRKLHL